MKKLKFLVIMAFILAAAMVFAACGDNDSGNGDNDAANVDTPAAEDPPDVPADVSDQDEVTEEYFFSLRDNAYFQGLAAGAVTDLTGTGMLEKHGDYDLTVGVRDGVNYLRLANRTYQADGIHLLNDAIDFQVRDMIIVRGRMGDVNRPDGWHSVLLQGNTVGWLEMATMDSYNLLDEYGNFELMASIVNPADLLTIRGGEPPAVRIMSNEPGYAGRGVCMDFYIYDIIIRRP